MTDDEGFSPFYLSLLNDYPNYISTKLLLEINTDYLQSSNEDGDTPLHLACKKPNIDLNIVKLLLDYSFLISSVKNKNLKIKIKIKKKKKKVNNDGNTALHLSLLSPKINEELVEILLIEGSNPKIENKEGVSPFQLAVEKKVSAPKLISLLSGEHQANQKNNPKKIIILGKNKK